MWEAIYAVLQSSYYYLQTVCVSEIHSEFCFVSSHVVLPGCICLISWELVMTSRLCLHSFSRTMILHRGRISRDKHCRNPQSRNKVAALLANSIICHVVFVTHHMSFSEAFSTASCVHRLYPACKKKFYLLWDKVQPETMTQVLPLSQRSEWGSFQPTKTCRSGVRHSALHDTKQQ